MSDTQRQAQPAMAALHGADTPQKRFNRRLDLSELASPAQPGWLRERGSRFTLPFDDDEFDSVVVGDDVLGSVEPAHLLAELGRIIRPGGELRISGASTDHEGAPRLADIIKVLTSAFRLQSIAGVRDQTVIVAARDDDAAARLAAVAAVLAGHIDEARRAAADLHGTATRLGEAHAELARTRDDLRLRNERIDEQRVLLSDHLRRIEALSASVATHQIAQRELAAARDRATQRAQAAARESHSLRAQVAAAQHQARHEKWRAGVAEHRKWLRIGIQIQRLKRPWLLPAVAYRVARIVAGPSFRPAAPRPPKPATNGRQTGIVEQIQQFQLPETAPRRPALRVGTLLDEFSELAFRYEFQLVRIPREGWREALEREPIDLLMVESAWNANGGAWRYAFTGEEVPKKPVLELLEYCRDHGVPTIFWNKEDPLEYDLFLRTARHFDWVFTVDENCVPRYRADLGHDRVSVLPFGVQPRIHNPTGSFALRPQEVAFAGTYYAGKYPERKEQIDNLLHPCVDLGLHIFSRWESDPKYSFPEHLKQSVVGTLDYPRILTAYRRYKVFLNVNSVTDSKTMFSRRVLELLACGTPVVSGPSPGMEALLGSGVVEVSTDPDATRSKVRALLRSPEVRDRAAVVGIRSVMNGNTYSDRIDHLLTTIGLAPGSSRRRVTVVAPTNRSGGFEKILENVGRQDHKDIHLVIALHGVREDEERIRQLASERGVADLDLLFAPSEWSLGRVLNRGCDIATGDYIAKFDDDDIYGQRYLSDQLLAFDYSDADIVGKWSRFIFVESGPCLGVIFPGHEHRYTELIGGGTILAKRSVFESVRFADRTVGEDTQFLRECGARGFRVYSTDRFNFVYMRYRDVSRHTYAADDLHHLSNTRVVSFGAALDHAFV